MRRQHDVSLDNRIMMYLQIASLAHLVRLNDHWFRLDEPLATITINTMVLNVLS
ncbi:hypothetical protein AHAS_Ahas02G0121300 [Arachis hypogaea]